MIMNEWQDRVTMERSDLQDKLDLLSDFIDTDPTFTSFTPTQRSRLQLQRTIMGQYVSILTERLEDE